MTLGLSHVELLSEQHCCQESNSSCCGGRLIVAVSCGREQIRIWIVLRGEAQQFPAPLRTPPTPAVHPHTHINTHSNILAASFWGKDKQLHIFLYHCKRKQIICTPAMHCLVAAKYGSVYMLH